MASFDSGTNGLVRWPGLILALIVTFLLTAALVGAATYWVLGKRHVQVSVPQHSSNIVFPKNADITFQLDKPIQLRAEQTLKAKADISGALNATVDKDIETTFTVSDDAEVKYTLRHDDNVKVESDLVADAREVTLKIGDKEIKATLTGQIRVSGEIPVTLKKDFAEKVAINVRAPAKVVLAEQFTLPVKSQIDVQIPLSANLSVAGEPQKGRAVFAQEPQTATIKDLTVKVPLQSLNVEGQR